MYFNFLILTFNESVLKILLCNVAKLLIIIKKNSNKIMEIQMSKKLMLKKYTKSKNKFLFEIINNQINYLIITQKSYPLKEWETETSVKQ